MSVWIKVYGKAQPAGSKRAFVHNGRAIVTDANKNSRPWKNDVAQAAADAMDGGELLEGPLSLYVTFFEPRPKAHFGARGLKPSAPPWPTKKPDATKLLRGVEDAMSGVVYRDDAQIVEQHVYKEYGEPARAEIVVHQLVTKPEEKTVVEGDPD